MTFARVVLRAAIIKSAAEQPPFLNIIISGELVAFTICVLMLISLILIVICFVLTLLIKEEGEGFVSICLVAERTSPSTTFAQLLIN